VTISPETKAALREALGAARGKDAGAIGALLARLQTEEELARLDSEADYVVAAKFRLRVAQVVEALARNPAPSAREAFVALTESPLFISNDERIIALIRASEHVRPPPPELVSFWDRHCQPDDGFTPTTIAALVSNASSPAIALLETKLCDDEHDEDERISWMRTDILTHRNDLPLLQSCERLITEGLPEHLRPLLVDALFDYRPGEWFKPAQSYSPPPLESASSEALDQIIKTAVVALTMVRLTDEQRQVVRERMRAAETLVDQRKARPAT
jgi:hypothetical protein